MHLLMLEHSYPSDACNYAEQIRDIRLSMTSDPLIFPPQYGMNHVSIMPVLCMMMILY